MSAMNGDRNSEIDCSHKIFTIAFSPDAAHIWSGGEDGTVRRWRASDGVQVGKSINAGGQVLCIAASDDGKWVVAGTSNGQVAIWDGQTHENATTMKHSGSVRAIDISPDLTRIATASSDKTVRVWDIASGRQLLGPLQHGNSVWAVNYSPDGTRIATSENMFPIRIFDSVDGKLVRTIRAGVNTDNGRPSITLGWSSDGQQLFAAWKGKIRCVDVATGAVRSEWQAHKDKSYTCLLTSRRKSFLVSSADSFIVFWDASTREQIGPVVERSAWPQSIALSPDSLHLAICARQENKITIQSLREVLPQPYLTDTSTLQRNTSSKQSISEEDPHSRAKETTDQESPTAISISHLPLVNVSDAAFSPWIQGDLATTEVVLTEEIASSSTHYALANRALVRARLRRWDAAEDDVKKSLDTQVSVIGIVANTMTLVARKSEDSFEIFDLAFTLCSASERNIVYLIKSIILFTAGRHDSAISHVARLVDFVENKSLCVLIQALMYIQLGNVYAGEEDYESAIRTFRRVKIPHTARKSSELHVISLIFGWSFDALEFTVQRHLCEALYASGRVLDATDSLAKMVQTFSEELKTNVAAIEWAADFTKRCIVTLEKTGDEATNASKHEKATSYYAAALSLNPTTYSALLKKWAKAKLAGGAWKEVISTATELKVPRTAIYEAICDTLEEAGRLTEAVECFREMESNLGGEMASEGEQATWTSDFKQRIGEKLEHLADTAAAAQRYQEAVNLYTAVLALRPATPIGLYTKRSKAWASVGQWEDALTDANKAIALDPSSPWGYDAKRVALLGAERHDEAFEAYETEFPKLSQSSDPEIRELKYVNPSKTEGMIRSTIARIIRNAPHVLINTTTGRIHNKAQRVSAFTSSPLFKKLLASMTTQIDSTLIDEEVKTYFRYAMLSHTWEDNEPSFQLVENISVYDLPQTPEHEKLKQFCRFMLAAGYVWAWSDTCCINQKDGPVLQESLVAMFTWYRGSDLTLVYLRGVGPSGSISESRWATRGWTYQEYVAPKVIRFYTEDWTLYQNLTTSNHKEAPEVISEMEKVAGALTPFIHGLQPGLDNIREKLCLASTRQTTREEDAAYSLLGIFSVSIPVMYGEGESAALGRLLGHLVSASGTAGILAWTGKSGIFNSCLPAHITAFRALATSHLPAQLSDSEINSIAASPQSSSLELASATTLYDMLYNLPPPWFAANRMKLPCIMFELGPLVVSRTSSGYRYHANTLALGAIEIRTLEELDESGSLYLVHPWINALLGEAEHSKRRGALKPSSSLVDDKDKIPTDDPDDQSSLLRSLPLPAPRAAVDKPTRVSHFIARLRRPFGALLLSETGRDYSRVASDALITVQVKEDTPLTHLIDNARTIDIL